MKIEIITVAVVAGLSFAGTVLLVGGRSVDADGEGTKPTLLVDGVALTVDHQSYAGLPTARLLAHNTTGEEARIEVRLRLMATRMASPESRMAPMAEEAWSQDELLVLAPGEQRIVELTAGRSLPARSTGRFIVSAGRQEVRTAQFRASPAPVERVRVERAVFAPSSGVKQGKVSRVAQRRRPAGARGNSIRTNAQRLQRDSVAQLAE